MDVSNFAQTLEDLTGLDAGPAADSAADAGREVMLTDAEILAQLYVVGVRAIQQTAGKLLVDRPSSPAEVFAAAADFRSKAQERLTRRCEQLADQWHRHLLPRLAPPATQAPLVPNLLPGLQYTLLNDPRNVHALTVYYGPVGHSDTLRDVISPGESLTLTGGRVWITGGRDHCLLGWSRSGGEYVGDVPKRTIPLPEAVEMPEPVTKLKTWTRWLGR